MLSYTFHSNIKNPMLFQRSQISMKNYFLRSYSLRKSSWPLISPVFDKLGFRILFRISTCSSTNCILSSLMKSSLLSDAIISLFLSSFTKLNNWSLTLRLKFVDFYSIKWLFLFCYRMPLILNKKFPRESVIVFVRYNLQC